MRYYHSRETHIDTHTSTQLQANYIRIWRNESISCILSHLCDSWRTHSVSASLRIYIQHERWNPPLFGKDHSGMNS